MKDIEIFGKEFNDVVGFKMPDTEDVTVTYTEGGGGSPTLETVTKTYTPSTSQQTETITPSSGYDGIGEVDVTVDAMPEGTLGSPVAVKGEITNHSMVVTPFVLTQAGYITTQSKSGTAVTVSASELDSGTKSITANGTDIDVVGYAAVDVAVPSSSPNLQSKTKTYTPTESQQTESVSADTGYDGIDTVDITVNAISSSYVGSGVTRQSAQTLYPSSSDQTIATDTYLTGTQTIKAVTTTNLSASNIKNGVTVEVGDSSDPDRVLSVTGTYSGGGSSKNVQAYEGYDETNTTDYTATDVSITVSKAGTYKCAWMGIRNTTSGTSGSRLYVNGTAVGSAHTSGWIRSYGQYATETLSLNANDVVTIYGRARASNYWMVVGNLILEEQ